MWRRETVRETVLWCMRPLEEAWRSRRSAPRKWVSSAGSPCAAARRTLRTALRTPERKCRLRSRRTNDWRWRFLAEG